MMIILTILAQVYRKLKFFKKYFQLFIGNYTARNYYEVNNSENIKLSTIF